MFILEEDKEIIWNSLHVKNNQSYYFLIKFLTTMKNEEPWSWALMFQIYDEGWSCAAFGLSLV